MPLRSQGYCGFGRGLSGLLWVWCNGRGPHLELRQEPQGSAPDFLEPDLTQIAGSLLSLLRSQVSCSAEEWNSAYISSCSRMTPLFVMCVEPAGFSEMHGGVSAPSCCVINCFCYTDNGFLERDIFLLFIQFKHSTLLISIAQLSESKRLKIKGGGRSNFRRPQTSGKHIKKHFYIQSRSSSRLFEH